MSHLTPSAMTESPSSGRREMSVGCDEGRFIFPEEFPLADVRGGLIKIMEKKQYIAPQMEIAELEVVEMLAASTKVFNIFGDTTDEDAWMSNDRRGTWGNLWDTGK